MGDDVPRKPEVATNGARLAGICPRATWVGVVLNITLGIWAATLAWWGFCP